MSKNKGGVMRIFMGRGLGSLLDMIHRTHNEEPDCASCSSTECPKHPLNDKTVDLTFIDGTWQTEETEIEPGIKLIGGKKI